MASKDMEISITSGSGIAVPADEVRNGLAEAMATLTALTKELYYICLWDVKEGAVHSQERPLNSIGATIPEFFFRVPPKSIEVGEPFATNIVPTQDGGKFVESHGSVIRDIKISGTTGFRPHTQEFSNTAEAVITNAVNTSPIGGVLAAANDLASVFGLGNSPWGNETLGHDDIILLRNIFRLYSEVKAGPSAQHIVMVWRNIKDADYWIVEPTEFRVSQNSSSPLTYDYSISFKTLAPFTTKIELSKDPLEILRDVRNAYAATEQISAGLRNSLLMVANNIDVFSKTPLRVTTFVMGPITGVLDGLKAVKRSVIAFKQNWKASQNDAYEKVKKTRDEYEALFVAKNPDPATWANKREYHVLNALNSMCRDLRALLALPFFQGDSVLDRARDAKQDMQQAYRQTPNPSGSASTAPALQGGSSSFIGNQDIPSTLSQDVVYPGETIRSIAERLLKDRNKWHVLVVINQLTAPYIAPVASQGVLAPGSTILYPAAQNATTLTMITPSSSTAETDGPDSQNSQGSLQQLFGRDIRAEASFATNSSSVRYDFQISQSGDLSTVVGLNNVVQAVRNKFHTRRGDLPAHPKYGALYPIGTKVTPASLAGLRLEIESTLLTDPRIESIKKLKILTFKDVVAVEASLNLINTTGSVRVTLPVREF